eukprot:4467191-Pyramimonas_sp.AAC.1
MEKNQFGRQRRKSNVSEREWIRERLCRGVSQSRYELPRIHEAARERMDMLESDRDRKIMNGCAREWVWVR